MRPVLLDRIVHACVPQNKLIGYMSEVRVISDETDPWEDQWVVRPGSAWCSRF